MLILGLNLFFIVLDYVWILCDIYWCWSLLGLKENFFKSCLILNFLCLLALIRIGNSMICSDISKLLYVISRAVRRVKFETILKYHEWYLCQILRTNHAIICLYYYPQRYVIFTCRYFKLRWNTTALSQSNCRNFSCSSIKFVILELEGKGSWEST